MPGRGYGCAALRAWNEVYVAEADGTLLPVRLLNKQENASVKREKLLLSEGGEG